MSHADRVKMMIQAKLENAHEKEKTKRTIRQEELEDNKKDRQREWRQQLLKQKERGHVDIDVDRFTNEQMERMVFDKDYNPIKDMMEKDKKNKDADEEPDAEEIARKAELKARFAAA